MMLDTLNHDDQDAKPNGVDVYFYRTQAPTTPELKNEAVQEQIEFNNNEEKLEISKTTMVKKILFYNL